MNLEEIESCEGKTDISKNTILYGPPGTGKTYNTIMYAVAIIENKKLEDIKSEDYAEITNRYNKYKDEGRQRKQKNSQTILFRWLFSGLGFPHQ